MAPAGSLCKRAYHAPVSAEARATIRDCEAKMTRHRAAIDAGEDIEQISQWINTAKAERLQAEPTLRGTTAPSRMTGDEIKAIVERFSGIAAVIRDPDPADKAEIYRGLNLMVTYRPETETVRAQAHLSADSMGLWFVSEGRLHP
jgi:site-specific DNA recombinase